MNQKILQLTFLLSFTLLSGFGCNYTRQLGSTSEVVASSTKNDWVTYTNQSYGISLDIPRLWKIAEYTSPDGIGRIAAIAFDPERVGTQAEYDSVDKAMGLVTVSLDEKVQPSDLYIVNKVTMGKNKIPADLLIQVCKEPDCPNPWWVDRVRVDYYVELPENKKTEKFDSIRISFQYPEGAEAEDNFRLTLEDIVASFEFINIQ